MKIVTFGSCLSRYIANQYVYIFGGKIVSSVYHNRSDAFYNKFIKKEVGFNSVEHFIEKYIDVNDSNDAPDNQVVNILNNQTELGIGLHRLASGTNFITALKEAPNLVIIDNYMDLAARLLTTHYGDDDVFINLSGVNTSNDECVVSDFLSYESSVFYMRELVSYILSISPTTKVVFVNFPWSTYVDENRILRTKQFEREFHHPNIDIIPCLTISPKMMTKQKQHFQSQQYAAYAGMIRNIIN